MTHEHLGLPPIEQARQRIVDLERMSEFLKRFQQDKYDPLKFMFKHQSGRYVKILFPEYEDDDFNLTIPGGSNIKITKVTGVLTRHGGAQNRAVVVVGHNMQFEMFTSDLRGKLETVDSSGAVAKVDFRFGEELRKLGPSPRSR